MFYFYRHCFIFYWIGEWIIVIDINDRGAETIWQNIWSFDLLGKDWAPGGKEELKFCPIGSDPLQCGTHSQAALKSRSVSNYVSPADHYQPATYTRSQTKAITTTSYKWNRRNKTDYVCFNLFLAFTWPGLKEWTIYDLEQKGQIYVYSHY